MDKAARRPYKRRSADPQMNEPRDQAGGSAWVSLVDDPPLTKKQLDEIDKETGYMRVDRPQRTSSQPPALYGFIPQIEKPDHRFNAGVTYLINSNHQLDVSSGLGLSCMKEAKPGLVVAMLHATGSPFGVLLI